MELDVLQAISTVGFPIVMCLMMFWQSTRVIRENTKAINELSTHLKR